MKGLQKEIGHEINMLNKLDLIPYKKNQSSKKEWIKAEKKHGFESTQESTLHTSLIYFDPQGQAVQQRQLIILAQTIALL